MRLGQWECLARPRLRRHGRRERGSGGARGGVKLEKKRRLLEDEGVVFDDDDSSRVAQSCIFDFVDEEDADEDAEEQANESL